MHSSATRRKLSAKILAALLAATLTSAVLSVVVAPPALAVGTTLFENSFNNRTVDGTGTVSKPTSSSGTNGACLTAAGNSATLPLLSCAPAPDAQGAGKLRLTNSTTNQVGGIFGATSFPTSNGLDVTFNTYQWGGGGADGMSFMLAAVDPANPVSPTVMGPNGGSLGYSPAVGVSGLTNAYLGVGLDVFGNFSNKNFEGTGCPAVPTISAAFAGAVVVRGPGSVRVGYCGLTTSYDGTAGSKVTLRATARAASLVPVQVLINPTASPFTSATGVVVTAGTYKVVFTPVGGAQKTLTGPLPTVPTTLYPSTSWLNAAGVPRQLAFGFTGTTGSVTDSHEIDTVKVVTFNPVPQLAVSTTSYVVPSPVAGAPVNYVITPSVLTGTNEGVAISVSQTVPVGVVPVAAYGNGWVCAAPVVRTITCTTTATSFTNGTTLPAVQVVAIVTGSTMTAATVQSSSPTTASSVDANQGTSSTTTAGTTPAAPSGVTVAPAILPIAGGSSVTVSGTNISAPTAIEIGTTAEQQAGTPVVLLQCPGAAAAGCFTISGSNLLISSMPARATAAPVTVTVVTLGVAAAASFVYADRPATAAAPTAVAGISSATVSWTAPASNGSPITSYVITPYLSGVAQTPLSYDTTSTSRTVTGLTAGSSYTFTVSSINAYGTSVASPASNAVTPYLLPGAPTITAASARDSAALLTWSAASSIGTPITAYVVTPYIGSVAQSTQTFASTPLTQTVTGLTPGTVYTFTVTGQNVGGAGPPSAKSAGVTPNVSPSLSFPAPPAGEVGAAYSQPLTVANGTSPFAWSVSSGALPAGLTLNPTSGLLSGTPTASGTFTFTVLVSDASSQTASKSVTLVIAAAPVISFSPAAGEVDVLYSEQPTVAGGTAPYVWSRSAGSVPPGLTLSSTTGLISGTPSASGSFAVTVQVVDSFNQVATRTVTIVVAALPTLTFVTPPSGLVGVPYTTTLTTSGGTAPLTWSLLAGTLPPGLVLDPATGLVSGSPTTVGSSSFTVSVVDANGKSATRPVTLVIAAAPLVILKTANTSSAAPGDAVGYTITISNTSGSAFSGITVSDPLTGVLDDAGYNTNATASTGAVSYTAPTLSWTGNIAANGSVTITYSVTVNSPATGNRILSNTVTSTSPATNCAGGSSDTRCTATVTVSGLTIVKTADVATTTPGGVVRFSIAITNSGQTAYSGASLVDTLAGALDDAAYNADAGTTSGSVSFTSPTLTWTGNLAVGATATVSYSVTVNDPDIGNRSLTGTVVSASAGSSCPAGNPAAQCSAVVTVLIPALSVSIAAGVSSTTPGGRINYTTTISNTGQTPFAAISTTVALAGALDDAAYGGDAVASAGAVSFQSGSLVWTGALAVGAVVTVTHSVTVNNPDLGDRIVSAVVSSTAAGSTCPPGGGGPLCSATTQVLVPALTITTTSDVSSTTPGSVVNYTVVVTNTGQTPYTGAAFAVSLAGVLDDATYGNNAATTTGTVAFTSPNLTWSANLAIGATATITYSVTVNNPDTGNKSLTGTVVSTTSGSNCASGSSDTRCTSTVTVLVPGLTITASQDAGASTTPGAVVHYTYTIRNSGQSPYTGIAVYFDLRGQLDDSTYNNDAVLSTGSTVTNPDGTFNLILTLAPGAQATYTFSQTVKNPDPGDKLITTITSSNAPGSNCPTGLNAACNTSIAVLIPGLLITKTASSPTVTPGEVVGYTIVVVNTGQTAYSAAAFTDSLASVLTDATYAGGATASTGSVSFAGSTLSWSGALGLGATATITYTVTIRDPDPGDKLITNTLVSTSPGSNCAAGSGDARCTAVVAVQVPGLTIVKSSTSVTTVPGAVVGFTVTVTNSGTSAFTGAAFADSLVTVLDDATYNANVAASTGTASYANPTISWAGDLAVGATATITYSVTVNAADVGNDLLTNRTISTTRGNNCATGSVDIRCTVTVPVARLILTQAFTPSTTTPGSVIQLTATFTNTGQVPFTGITVDSLGTDVLDDATPNGDQTTSAGTLTLSATAVSWSGSIPVGGVITNTGTLTVLNPDTGNKSITGKLVATIPGNNCPAGSIDARCTAQIAVLIPGLTISTFANTASAVPGEVVGYTVTIHNTGQTAYTAATVTDALGSVLDDATYNAGAAATSGAVSFTAPTLTWTGDLAVGATATVTFSVTVRSPDPGDKGMSSTVTSTAVGSSCAAGTANTACTNTVLVLTPALTILKTANTTAGTLGSPVAYTVIVTNTGQTPYAPAAFTDTLVGVLDDAAYNAGGTTATVGTVSFNAGVLSWSGPLAVGAAATISYTVTITKPASGDGILTNTISSTTVGNNCAATSTDTRCTATVAVINAATLTFTKTADVATTVPGAVVNYTVRVLNSSTTDIAGVNFTDPLAGVLDDAAYNDDAAATAGTPTFTSPNLSWTGTVPAGGTVTISYSVTVHAAITGNGILASTLTSTSAPSSNNCIGGGDPRCTTTVPIAALVIQQSAANPTSTTPGSVIRLTATFTNTGQVPYTGITITSPSATISDDTVVNGDQTATSGLVTVSATAVSWTGSIPVGGSVTVTGTVTVHNPDPGDKTMTSTWQSTAVGNNCQYGSDPRCTSVITVLVPGLTINKTASTPATVPGGSVGYTVTVFNSGQTPYTGITVTDSLDGVLDDATFNGDATTNGGALSFTSPVLSWTGNLAVGATVTITYSVTVLDPDLGDKGLSSVVTSTAVGSSCPVGSGVAGCQNTVAVLTAGLTIIKTVDLAAPTLGAKVTYTVTVTNSGQTAYPAAAFTDPLGAVVDDATYNADAVATTGTIGFAAGVLSWSGALAPGAVAAVTYSVTINSPATGNRILMNTVTSATPGNNCTSGSTDTRCTATATVTNAATLTFTKTANVASTVAGGVVSYTVRALNSSGAPLTGVNFTDSLSGVLDDAAYNGNAVASAGSVTFTSPNLAWVGDIPAGGTVTVTYAVTVHTTITGDQLLTGTVSSTSVPASDNCLAATVDTRCTATVPVAALLIQHSDLGATTTPGAVLHPSATFTNTGRFPYVGITLTSPGSDLLDDVIPAGDQVASSGSLAITPTDLTWTGDIPVGGVITITGSMTVQNPDPGNKLIVSPWVSTAPGSNCPTASSDPQCAFSIAVLVPGLTITKTASGPTVVPGGTVGYTIAISNGGQTPYVAATVTDSLVGILDDATYNADAAAAGGAVSYNAPTLTWTGDLAVGATVTVTYSVTVRNPDPGDKTMINTVTSDAVGSNCLPASGNAACRSTVLVLTPRLTIVKTSNLVNATLGATVSYSVLVTNSGQTPFAAAAFTDALAGVVDDATYNSNAAATSGSVGVTGGVLSWSGALNPGLSATITYTVTVNNPDTGDRSLANTIVSTTPGNNCATGSPDTRCTTTVAVVNTVTMTFAKTADVLVTSAGSLVTYTVTATNSSGGTVVGANFTDPLAGIIDDATYNGNASATSGTLSYTAPNLGWTGDIPAGGTVTVTYTVTVHTTVTGDQILVGTLSSTSVPASDNCIAGSQGPRCTSTVPVAALLIVQSYTETSTTPGALVHLSATFTNTGQAVYNGISISSPSANTIDDAIVTGDQTASAGTLVLSASAITWTGNLAIGATVTVSGTLTVQNPDPGNKLLTGTLVSAALGSNCPALGSDPRCTASLPVLVPALTITTTANTSAAVPGATVGYTVTVHNTGQTAYTAATVITSLAGVLGDAVYNNNATSAGVGSVGFAGSTLTWTGELAAGATATITYTVTVNNPDTGDRVLASTVSSTDVGSTCPPASSNVACQSSVVVLSQALTIVKSANLTAATLGATVTYTITVTNSGQSPYPSASVTDDLSAVTDDAPYNVGSATASVGTVGVTAGVLSWSGPLAPAAFAVISYTVTVNNPALGNRLMVNSVVSTAPGTNCVSGGSDPRCTATVAVTNATSLTFTSVADVTSGVAGGVVNYTVFVLNSSTSPATGVTFTLPLGDVLDDATLNGAPAASAGLASLAGSDLSWSGDVPAGGTVAVTYSVTVKTVITSNHLLASKISSGSVPASNNCLASSIDPRCASIVPIASLLLVWGSTAATVLPGGTLNYSATFTNTGAVAYQGISVDVLAPTAADDVLPSVDFTADSGTLVIGASGIIWTGNIAPGGVVTLSASLTIQNPDLGDKNIVVTMESDAIGNNCPHLGNDPRCAVTSTVTVPELTISKTANISTVAPGGTVAYTVTVANTGDTDYVGASVTDALGGVLNDASYNANATTTSGALSFAAPTLTWTGNLLAGDTVTISYSVTVPNPATGDRVLASTVSSTDVGSSCPPASGNPACSNVVTVLTQALTIVKTATPTAATLGSIVSYTVTVTDSGQTPYATATFTDTLAGVIDDAAYNANASATIGGVTFVGGAVVWSGALNPGQTATITYSVTITNPAAGNGFLAGTLISSTPDSNCASGSTDVRCAATVVVVNATSLTFSKTADVATTVAGATVTFTVRVLNSSTAALTGVTFTDPLDDVLDDAAYNNDAAVTAGTATFDSPNLRWTGAVPAGGTVTVTYSVTVHSTITGDQNLTGRISSSSVPDSNNCLTDSTDPLCSATVPVASLHIEQLTAVPSTTPGSVLHVILKFTNTGKVPYTGITISNLSADVLDDATAGLLTSTSGVNLRTATAVLWTGDIPVGGAVTTDRTLTVQNPDLGNKVITGTLTSTAAGNNCPAAGTDPGCTFRITVLTPGLTITKTADTTFVLPGQTAGYTITVQNTGETPYTAATLTAATAADNLTGVLDDAAYNGDAAAGSGSVGFAGSTLTWTGDLALAATVTITYTVTARSPASGDKLLANVVSSTDPGSSCPAASANLACRSNVAVLTPGLTITSTANTPTSVPGGTVTYTVTAANTGQTPYATAAFTIPLGGVLDDATYSATATASTGVVDVTGSTLTWTGPLGLGGVAIISYTVTVADPVVGDFRLEQTVTSTTSGNNCAAGSTDPRCTTAVPIASLRLVNAANVSTAKPTDVISYTGTFTNLGQVPYVGITIVSHVLDATDDAVYNGDGTATSGTVSIVEGSPTISWTGDLAVNQTVVFTLSVTVKNPDSGNKSVISVLSTTAAGSNCPDGSLAAACRNVVTVQTPGLTITNTADTSTTTPGSLVNYTIVVSNTGQTAYTAANISEGIAGILNDAAYVSSSTNSGNLSYAAPTLTWVGDLVIAGTVTINFTVRVNNPYTGDHSMMATVISDELGSVCPTGGTLPACTTLVTVLVPTLGITITSDSTTSTPGATVGYIITATNLGETSYPGATVTVGLLGALDDAGYGGGTASVGSVTFTSPNVIWTGDLVVGGTATITYSMIVADPDIGNQLLTTSVTSPAAGSTCTEAAPCLNTVTVLIPGLDVSTTANVTSATPGDSVVFTITVQNTGQTAYVGTTVSTALTGVLDDASFAGTISASIGVATYTAPTLSWTGTLPVGATAIISYTVVITDPDLGDQTLTSTVIAPAPGSNCEAGSGNASCTATLTVLVPSLSITTSAGAATTTPGSVVSYTVALQNTGQTAYTAISVVDSLAGVLPDSVYSNDAVAGSGVLTYLFPNVTWTGDLAIGATVNITFSVTVRDPDPGDKFLVTRVSSAAPGNSCPVGNALPACSAQVRVLVPGLLITKTADTSVVAAGQPVTYTVTVRNIGETVYAPAAFTDSLAGVLDDAGYAGGATATVGTLDYTSNTLTWTGGLGLGVTATIIYSVTTTFPAAGNRTLSNTALSASPGSNCATGLDPLCSSTVTVLVPALAVAKTADTSQAVAGGVVRYTITATNTGQAGYPTVTLTDSLADVTDDAAYDGDATANAGSVNYAGGTLTWTGPLAVGATVLITYSVTVSLAVADSAVLINRVVSDATGSTCILTSENPLCATSISIAARFITLGELTSAFTLSGPPGSTVTADGAVTMTVTTNSASGYLVIMTPTSPSLTGTGGNTDTIPITALGVRESGAATFAGLVAQVGKTLHHQTGPSAPGGDAVSNDYQVVIPYVLPDNYSGNLEYIVAAGL